MLNDYGRQKGEAGERSLHRLPRSPSHVQILRDIHIPKPVSTTKTVSAVLRKGNVRTGGQNTLLLQHPTISNASRTSASECVLPFLIVFITVVLSMQMCRFQGPLQQRNWAPVTHKIQRRHVRCSVALGPTRRPHLPVILKHTRLWTMCQANGALLAKTARDAHGYSASCFAVTSLSIKVLRSVAQNRRLISSETHTDTGRVKSSKTDFHPANDMRTRLLHGGCLTVAPRCAHFVAPFPRKACDSTASGHVHSQSAGEGSTASHAPSPPQRTLHKHEPPTTRSPTAVEMFTTKHRKQMRGDFSVCRGTNTTFPIGCIHHTSVSQRANISYGAPMEATAISSKKQRRTKKCASNLLNVLHQQSFLSDSKDVNRHNLQLPR
ncbi:hypothetical protein, conserved in T. vivax [Trypanosoma vivax Y486]|uniref:Uncharacterized protein n=1 Tax=Trypanosoma vivax (strain Y486) TaxID=1055687 RepID=F9WN86_TRYVY|nr:hypothetical protein, conserved in T. vivax [Trypanosoma vivax Y486]|eukprot:CCD19002.1 hypothetical protein, conserved in T. vivax [Trypanosoma vivax Y486]